ncbi:MAG: DUF1048 domain-containing protein [Coriobacteriales bacterium]|nr:DUF1048 domain-containing protein [Coriobacteriales bacterium]
MSIKNAIDGKREWRALVARVKALPPDYQIVYKEIRNYYYKVGPVGLTDSDGILAGIVDLFEAGAASGRAVLEVTGQDIAAFCDGLIEGLPCYSDGYLEAGRQAADKAMQKVLDKAK